MEQYISEIVYWHWFIFAIVLLVLEMLISGFFFLWLGAAAISVGAILAFRTDMGWEQQGLVFAVLSIVYLVGFKYWRSGRDIDPDQSTLNKRGHQYIGRVLLLKEALVNGRGRASVDDGVWQVRSEDESDIEAGQDVEVTDVIRTTLIIKKQSTQEE